MSYHYYLSPEVACKTVSVAYIKPLNQLILQYSIFWGEILKSVVKTLWRFMMSWCTQQQLSTSFANTSIATAVQLVDTTCPSVEIQLLLISPVVKMFSRIRSRSGYVACAIASSVSLLEDFWNTLEYHCTRLVCWNFCFFESAQTSAYQCTSTKAEGEKQVEATLSASLICQKNVFPYTSSDF